MTAGLPADPTDGAPPGLVHASDWIRFVLGQHPAVTPGSRFVYSSDGSHLPTLRYAQAKLFGPLGIASDHPFEPLFAPRN